jgi:hypothetical protein
MLDLLKWLDASDFYTAPASSRFHLSKRAGLAEHSWNVFCCLVRIIDEGVPHQGELDDSLRICGLLHDICKVNLYVLSARNIKKDGKWLSVPCYDLDDKFPCGHGEKSVILIQQFIKLTMDEQLAIRWHMGAWDATSEKDRRILNDAFHKSKLVQALMIADQMAAFKETK